MKSPGFKIYELIRTTLFVLILLLASPQTASGDPKSVEHAKAAVRGWLKADGIPLNTKLGQKIKRAETFKDKAGTALYHVVYLDPEGFVIVAGDDLIEPIIGFAPHGQFDQSTKNPLGALVSRDLPSRHARVKGLKSATAQGLPLAAKNKWERLNSMDVAGSGSGLPSTNTISDVWVAPLTQTTWDQLTLTVGGEACYNYYTPPYAAGAGTNYYCGCVATAMAQLMYYYQYPVNGVGTALFSIKIKGQAATRNLRGGDGNGGAYSWSNMVLNPAAGANDTQRQAIGALCADAGVAVNMNYGDRAYGGSGADTSTAKDALITTFGYANAIYGHNTIFTNIGSSLYGMVNPNLDAGCPVLFGITDGNTAHEIVCDGYGYNLSAPYHHLNLGWGGGPILFGITYRILTPLT